jgi:hypothetical protein
VTIGIALVVIFVLYLIDKNNVWRQAAKTLLGLSITAVVIVGGFYGWIAIGEWRAARKADAAKLAEASKPFDFHFGTTNSGAEPSKPMSFVVEVHGGDTLKIIPGPEPQGTADFTPVPGSSVPLVYLGHNQKFLFACGETGESQFPTSYPKKEKGVTVCP